MLIRSPFPALPSRALRLCLLYAARKDGLTQGLDHGHVRNLDRDHVHAHVQDLEANVRGHVHLPVVGLEARVATVRTNFVIRGGWILKIVVHDDQNLELHLDRVVDRYANTG